MRGEARGRRAAEERSGRTCAAEPVAEDVRLLPADARGCRHGGVVARRQGDAGAESATIRRSARPTCFAWATSLPIRAILPAPRSISPWSI